MRLSRKKIISQLRFTVLWISLTIFGLLVALVISVYGDIPYEYFTRDTSVLADVHVYYGFFSNVGALLLAAATTICFFSFWLLFLKKENKGSKLFLFYSGIITLILLLDDFFMLHDSVIPYLFGIDEKYVLLFYIISTLVYLFWFRKHILETKYLIMVMAFVFFALSSIVDLKSVSNAIIRFTEVTFGENAKWLPKHLFEDGFKLLGIVCWLNYFWSYSVAKIRDSSKSILIDEA